MQYVSNKKLLISSLFLFCGSKNINGDLLTWWSAAKPVALAVYARTASEFEEIATGPIAENFEVEERKVRTAFKGVHTSAELMSGKKARDFFYSISESSQEKSNKPPQTSTTTEPPVVSQSVEALVKDCTTVGTCVVVSFGVHSTLLQQKLVTPLAKTWSAAYLKWVNRKSITYKTEAKQDTDLRDRIVNELDVDSKTWWINHTLTGLGSIAFCQLTIPLANKALITLSPFVLLLIDFLQ